MFDAFQSQLELIEDGIRDYFATYSVPQQALGLQVLAESMGYSLLSGGKRVRPLVGILLTEALGAHPRKTLPWVTAVEMIHTYSLIHDDLPCMDDDDERRGRATNHRVFGESIALLAGDTLLTEAFHHVGRSYADDPAKAIRAVILLSEAAGFWGMAGGQAMDLEAQKKLPDQNQLLEMQAKKTGALFRMVCEGVAVLCGTSPEIQNSCRQFGTSLGLCFQLADDLIDSKDAIEKGSLPDLIGLPRTREFLDMESARAFEALSSIGIQTGPLIEIVKWNQHREI